MANRCIIIGSGNSIRQGDYTSFTKDLPIWDLIKDEYTIGINWSKNYFDSTILLYTDYNFWQQEKDSLRKIPLVIGSQDAFYGKQVKKHWCQLYKFENIYLLPGSRTYKGFDSWRLGFYTRRLTGIYAISLSIALGFTEIYLLGMDCTVIDGRTHFYEGDNGVGIKRINGKIETGVGIDSKGRYKTSIYNNKNINENFECFKNTPVKIYNVSPESKITVFPKYNYEEFQNLLKTDHIKINQQEKRNEFISLHKEYYG